MKDLYTLKNIKHCWKKLKKKQISGKISSTHGLEELTLLKSPYYLKQPTESVHSLSKSQAYFFT